MRMLNKRKPYSLAGAVISGVLVKMGVGGDFTITSRTDSGQTSNKQKSVSINNGNQ
ncbi:hypothetical protein ME1_01208 [Bartonella vinsonii subsp. arupensis OK-94-513]|uniref:Uncharacterized protein n=2 Tax=Bartonella vinsonii subsp. arupensis TaxID=110578 RepID=J0QPF9_BARVI|nr:hemagglutinin repeat-containing protein [Bartonella vinsonii]EJF87606.1 hypothetical protein ME1_01208 [Bartonella vinsonii subsp. arupensis OK-94-513]EJF98687.1 hypothetical protein MEI_00257 [Bartonella vinsonii subsp. arupensis Pm136co]